MRTRLLLHAGTHKTGTTSIQRTLAANRDTLREQGVWYPAWGRAPAHHGLAHGVAQAELAECEQFLDRVAEQARPGETVLLSAEPICRHVLGDGDVWDQHRTYLKALAGLLDRFDDVEVLLYLRRRDTYAESLYKESVSKGNKRTDGFLPFVESMTPRFDYDREVDIFRDVFSTVTVRCYDTAQPVVGTFLDDLGVTVGDTVRWNDSVDTRLTLWLAEQPADDWKRQREFARSDAARSLFPPDKLTLWPSAAARGEFLSRWRGGEFGVEWFPPADDTATPARLSDDDRCRIGEAYRQWSVSQ